MRRATLIIVSLLALISAAILLATLPQAISARKQTDRPEVAFSSTGVNVKIFSTEVSDTLRLMIISDTHLFLSDEREEPFSEYSARMAGAYNSTRHFQTGETTNPEQAFIKTLQLAQQGKADAIALLGDMVSYPSERGVEWLQQALDTLAIPYYYTCGNHDWHYEGMEGAGRDLREKWRAERLQGLFAENNPDVYAVEMKGVRLLFVDDSTYEVMPSQLEAAAEEVKGGKPFIVLHHIPFYAPGRSVSYGIGHPEWGAATDRNYKIERREQWPAEGHTKVDYAFYDMVTSAPNLLASFAGHVHSYGVDIINGRPHYTVGANAQGAYYMVTIMPMAK